MCLVVDTCTFPAVFNVEAADHERFAPILLWLTKGKGKLIFGGSKYAKELSGTQAIGVLAEFDRAARLVRIDDKQVDAKARELKKLAPEKAFNDEHIVALVILSRCCVVCTDDQRATPYLQRKDLYPKGIKRPRIYKRAKNHADLCCDENVVGACKR